MIMAAVYGIQSKSFLTKFDKTKFISALDKIRNGEEFSSSCESSDDDDEETANTSTQFSVDVDPNSDQVFATEKPTEKPKELDISKLSMSIEPNLKPQIYINLKPLSTKKEQMESISNDDATNSQKSMKDDIMKKSVIQPGFEGKESVPPYMESLKKIKKRRREERAKSKGSDWYDMPATEMTEEIKNDLLVLKMRNALDPKQFYKRNDLKVLPKYFQVGRVVDNAADFYNSRIPKKQRRKTLVQELMADAEFQKFKKKKIGEVHAARSKTRKAYSELRKGSKKNYKRKSAKVETE